MLSPLHSFPLCTSTEASKLEFDKTITESTAVKVKGITSKKSTTGPGKFPMDVLTEELRSLEPLEPRSPEAQAPRSFEPFEPLQPQSPEPSSLFLYSYLLFIMFYYCSLTIKKNKTK